MYGLHGGDHSDSRKPLHVLRVDTLRVLDAWAPDWPRLPMRGQRVQCPPHGAIADRVEAHVELGASASLDHFDKVRLGQTRGTGAVEHFRGSAAQRPVEKRLHAPDPEPL